MKKINFRFFSILIVLLSLLSVQDLFSAIIIRKDDPDPGSVPMGVARMSSLSSSSKTYIQVTADVSGSDLIVDFNSTVGTAFVSVVDQSGNVVYQTTVDTFTTSELVIPLDGLSSGNYSLKISYGSTKLIGDFQL